MLEFYIVGGYISILLYALLVENVKDFREYMIQLMEVVIKTCKIEKTHAYTLISAFSIILLFASWIGFIILMLLIGDFLIAKYKKRMKI